MDPVALTFVMPITAVRASTAEPTTAVLTRALRDGDEAAWRDFHTAYAPRLLRYLLVVCRGQEDIAREALQQTFLRAVRHMRTFAAEDELWSWLTVLARCSASDLGRRDRRYLGFLARWFRQQPAPEPGPPDAERHLERLLAAELASLPVSERELLERKYLHGAAVRDLAGELGTSEKAVESRLTRARQHLKTAILARLKDGPHD